MSAGFSLDAVSAEFPCGAAWLANAFIELDLHLAELWSFDTAREWQPVSAGHRYVADDLPWRQTMASLRVGRDIRRTPGHRIRFTHGFPWQLDRAPRSVIVVRDPRDALYSQWRRYQRNQALDAAIDLPTFCSSAFSGSSIARSDFLWLHMASWLDCAERDPDNVLLVRFEDCKSQPAQQLQRVSRWLNLPVSTEQLARAADASDVRHLQQLEQQFEGRESSKIFNRAGRAFEWKTTWSQDWHHVIGAHWKAILSTLDYDAPAQPSEAAAPEKLSTMLETAGIATTVARLEWAERLAGWS